jgi:hypothetical protein
MNSNTVIYSIPSMYHYHASSLPPPSSNHAQYYHHYYSVPPLQVYAPVQLIQQQYYENYLRQTQYNSQLYHHKYYQYNQHDCIPTRSGIQFKASEAIGRSKQYHPPTTIGKSGKTDIAKPKISTGTKTKSFSTLKSMKSAISW